jgi:RNA polymerase sporulation-specific sigma factor
MAMTKVELCGMDTSSLPKLTGAQMTALMDQVKQGVPGARDAFIQSNLRLVLSVIQRFAGRGESPDDLFQVGCMV